MPHISLSLYPGRKGEVIEAACHSLQQCLVDTALWKLDSISVSVEEIEPDVFISQVKSKAKSEKIVISSDYIK